MKGWTLQNAATYQIKDYESFLYCLFLKDPVKKMV